MNQQLNTGVSNIIAIDIPKKDNFYQKREAALNERRMQNPPQQVINQDTINAHTAVPNAQVNDFISPSIPVDQMNQNILPGNFEQPTNTIPTNADIISQNFSLPNTQVAPNPLPVEPQIQHEIISEPQNITSNDSLLEIFNELIRLQDGLDKVMGKLVAILPNKAPEVSIPDNVVQFNPYDNQIQTNNISAVHGNHEELLNEFSPVQNSTPEISPFIPSSDNIFDQQVGNPYSKVS